MIEGENSSLVVVITFDDEHDINSLAFVDPKTKIPRVPGLNEDGLDKLTTVLDNNVKAVAIEYEYIDKDYRDTFSGFHSKRFSTPSSRCTRLHFFSDRISKSDLKHQSNLDSNAYCHKKCNEPSEQKDSSLNEIYLGYSVIRPTRPNCLGRTLLSISIMDMPDAHVTICTEKVNIQGCDFTVTGFPFMSQDGDSIRCAQSAFWMVARYFCNRYSLYPEIYPFEITTLAGAGSEGRRLYPSNGMYMEQISEAFCQIGFFPLVYYRESYAGNDEKFERLLYTYIESGIPLVVGLPEHAIAAFGHTFDSPLLESMATGNTQPEKDVTFSAKFCDGFIISNDNHYPYEFLPRECQTADELCVGKIDSFVVPLPEKVFLGADDFEEVAKKLFLEDYSEDDRLQKYSIEKLSPSLAGKKLILRIFLTTVKSFKAMLPKRGMGNAAVADIYKEIPLPHFVWVCEISTMDAYNKDNVLGEIIWDATRNAYEPEGWIALHYPEKLIFDIGSALNRQQEILTLDLNGSSEYPLYRSNLKEAQWVQQ